MKINEKYLKSGGFQCNGCGEILSSRDALHEHKIYCEGMEKSLGDHERKNPRDLDKREEEEKTVEEFLKESLWECARCGTPFHFEEDLKTHEFHCKKSQNTSQHGQHHYRNNAKGWAQPIVS